VVSKVHIHIGGQGSCIFDWSHGCKNSGNTVCLRKIECLTKDHHIDDDKGGFMKSALDVIEYIENRAEIAIPVERSFDVLGNHITKKEYGKILLEILCKELRTHFCKSTDPQNQQLNISGIIDRLFDLQRFNIDSQ
jgi:hypothetical protein